jgi:hypothetical protein
MLLDMSPESRVDEILHQMRRRHLIPGTSQIEPHILFPSHRYTPLGLDNTLRDVGIQNLSVVHIRVSVPGGSRNAGKQNQYFQ